MTLLCRAYETGLLLDKDQQDAIGSIILFGHYSWTIQITVQATGKRRFRRAGEFLADRIATS